jgi:hypothetical protein
MYISPETTPIIQATIPAHANGADAAKAVCLKNAKGVLIIVSHGGNTNTDYAMTLHEGDSKTEAEAGTHVVAATVPIWLNEHVATTDLLSRQTDAAGLTLDGDHSTGQIAAFYVPAAALTAGRPWLCLGNGAGDAANFISVVYILDGERYQQAEPLTAIA